MVVLMQCSKQIEDMECAVVLDIAHSGTMKNPRIHSKLHNAHEWQTSLERLKYTLLRVPGVQSVYVIDMMRRRMKEQWRGVQAEEKALKGDEKAFNCNKEALN